MSLANWSDIMDICKDNAPIENFRGIRRRKIAIAQLLKWQKELPAPVEESRPHALVTLKP
ncbi:hypothetical protein [Ammoniphilus sp. 3BR4]|uniref:hypothetical protein n=1 Tax=Ammoniphilus sp. 3BR4 TaxID=3158265 RepID=UPI0034654D92